MGGLDHVQEGHRSGLAHVVLDGYLVRDVLDRDHRGRPTTIRAAGSNGYIDTLVHGWRAHALTPGAEVDWDGDTQIMALGEQV